MTDEQLVTAFLDGDQSAFTELANRHREYLVTMIAKRSRDWDGAEDIVQKALVKIYRHVGSFDPAKLTFKQWICLIAMNCWIDVLRQRKDVTNWDTADLLQRAHEERANEKSPVA